MKIKVNHSYETVNGLEARTTFTKIHRSMSLEKPDTKAYFGHTMPDCVDRIWDSKGKDLTGNEDIKKSWKQPETEKATALPKRKKKS